MLTFSDAQKWWEGTFSSSLINDHHLPDPDIMSRFWKKTFPIFSLLSDNITNTDQYWKRIQRIMGQFTSNNNDIPCPFQRPKQFVSSFYQFVQELNTKSIQQLFISLESMPKSYDPQTILWSIPSAIDNPQIFLSLIELLYTSNHYIWNALISCDGGCDLIFDRFLPYISPESYDLPKQSKHFRNIALDIVTSAFIKHPNFPDSLDSILPNFLAILQKGDAEHSIYCFRILAHMFKLYRFDFSVEKFNNYVKDFSESAMVNPVLKSFVGPCILSLNIQEISISFLAQLYLQNKPDHNDILFIEKNLSSNCENSNSIILRILSLSITDKIYCQVYLHLLKSIKLFFSSNIPSVAFFIQRIVGFIIIAKSRNTKRRTVSMIFELLKTLRDLGYEWLKNEISRGAAILLASQEVPLAFVNSLKPSMNCDKSELIKWQKLATDSSFDIKSLLSENCNFNINSSNHNNNNINSKDIKGKANSNYPIHPKPPLVGTRSAPMRNVRASQKGKVSSISKAKTREVKRPLVKPSQNKFFQICRDNQS